MYKKKNAKKTYGIIGLGRFGYALAIELATADADIMVLDRDEEKVRELRDYTDNAYVVHQKLYFSENVHASIHRSKHSSLMLNLTIYQ